MDQKVMDLAERVAALEAHAERGAEDREEIKESLAQTNTALHELLHKISKWEGKFGGIVFILGCLVAFFSGLMTFIKNYLTTFGVPGK